MRLQLEIEIQFFLVRRSLWGEKKKTKNNSCRKNLTYQCIPTLKNLVSNTLVSGSSVEAAGHL